MKIQLLVKSAFGQASVSTNPPLTLQDRFYFRSSYKIIRTMQLDFVYSLSCSLKVTMLLF